MTKYNRLPRKPRKPWDYIHWKRYLDRNLHMLSLSLSGMHIKEIAKRYNLVEQRVRQILEKQFNYHSSMSRGNRLTEEGKRQRGISGYIDVLLPVVQKDILCRVFEITMVSNRPKFNGRKAHTSALYTISLQDRILYLWNSGGSLKEIAEYLSITVNHTQAAIGRARQDGKDVRRAYHKNVSRGTLDTVSSLEV